MSCKTSVGPHNAFIISNDAYCHSSAQINKTNSSRSCDRLANVLSAIIVMALLDTYLQGIISLSPECHSFTEHKQCLQLRQVGERIDWNHRDSIATQVPVKHQFVPQSSR